jgi:MFS transporter, CP family, cyanate transporter
MFIVRQDRHAATGNCRVGARDSNGGNETRSNPQALPVRARFLARIPNTWILLACIGLLALNLRGPFVAVAPVVDVM